MTSKKWIFIVNPISGHGKARNIPQYLEKYFRPLGLDFEIHFTQHAGHGRELATQFRDKADYIIAVGGDGTLHEVGSSLIGSEKSVLGIIPCGSGNGLARYLGIPNAMKKAVKHLLHCDVKIMDTGLLNEKPFLCVCGFGFDALTAHKFAAAGSRGFSTYFKIVRKEFGKYKPLHFSIEAEGKKLHEDAFILAVANATQFGNNVYINPLANVFDGKLNLTLIKPFRTGRVFPVLSAMRKARTHQLKEFSEWSGTEFNLEANLNLVHVDGEPIELAGPVQIRCVPQSLRILC